MRKLIYVALALVPFIAISNHVPEPLPFPEPEPVPQTVTAVRMTKQELAGIPGIIAELPEDFVYSLTFRITSFDMVTIGTDGMEKRIQARGARLSEDQKKAVLALRPGSRVIFENIIASGSDGTTRRLNALMVTVR